jgi:hypothetical protein
MISISPACGHRRIGAAVGSGKQILRVHVAYGPEYVSPDLFIAFVQLVKKFFHIGTL